MRAANRQTNRLHSLLDRDRTGRGTSDQRQFNDALFFSVGMDTLIVTGTTTSGCVRAAVIDAFSLNYKLSIVEECTFDRFESSHAINLFDMQAKYCDVLPLAEVTAYFDTLERGLYDGKIAFPAAREPVPA